MNPSAQIIPPEALPDQVELDQDTPPRQRFDLPKSLRLEPRGVTSHPTPHKDPTLAEVCQPEFWSANTAHKNSIAAKLRAAGQLELAQGLEDCHSTWTIAHCNDCGREERFPNRCDRFYCPECAPRLARERKESVYWWAREVKQPKHVTLTVKNIPDLTTAHVAEFKRWFSALRRLKFARNWLGGFYRLELTNEKRGWHLHLHALIDAHYIDKQQLSEAWRKQTRGFGYIVHVRDARAHDYLHQVTKYVAKGAQVAAWSATDILTYINAFTGSRTFGVFGSLYGKRTEWAQWIATLKDERPLCPCGSSNVRYITETEALMLDLAPSQPTATRPPPPTHTQHELAIQDPRCWVPHRRD